MPTLLGSRSAETARQGTSLGRIHPLHSSWRNRGGTWSGEHDMGGTLNSDPIAPVPATTGSRPSTGNLQQR